MDQSPNVPPASSPPRIRWWPAVAVLGTGAAAFAWLWISDEDNRSRQSFYAYAVVLSTILLLTAWFSLYSNIPFRKRLYVWGFLGLCLAAFVACVRVDGFTGETFPILAWRWSDSPQERARQFVEQARKNKPVTRVAARPIRNETPSDAAQPGAPLPPQLALTAPAASTAADKPVAGPDDWPTCRGPRGDGIAGPLTMRTDWNTRPPRTVWRHPVGAGWSSFTVVGDRCWTMEQRGDDEAVVCYDFDTGAQIWEYTYPAHFFREPGGEGPRSTPTWFEGDVYSLGATGILTQLKSDTGEKVSQRDTLAEAGASVLPWGNSASVLVYRNEKGEGPFVVVNPGGSDNKSVVAYGPKPWQAGAAPAGYASPQLVTLAGRQQVLVYDGTGIAGYNPTTGERFWRQVFVNLSQINAAQPIIVGDQSVFISSGYSLGSLFLEIGSDPKPREVWKTTDFRCKFNSPVLLDGHVYGLDEGVLACLDLQTGKRLWKKGRYGFGQVLLVGRTLLVQTEKGDLCQVEISPEGPKELTKFKALEAGRAWNEMALSRGRLLMRNHAEAVCFALEE